MESQESISEALFQYVKENTFKETDTLRSDTMLFVEGIFDSMGFALLLDFLEEQYGIVAEDGDLVEENFESIDSIVRFIQSKTS
jgi:acyl carrier protein